MEATRTLSRFIIAAVVFCTVPLAVYAQDEEPDILNPTGEVVGSPEGPYDVLDDQPAGLTDELCRYMIFYVPPPGVNYEEGKDAYGNSVTPADDPDTPRFEDPEASFYVNLSVNLAKRLGVDLADGVTAEALTGMVIVDHGRIYFNDKPLVPNAVDVLLDDCGQGMVNFE